MTSTSRRTSATSEADDVRMEESTESAGPCAMESMLMAVSSFPDQGADQGADRGADQDDLEASGERSVFVSSKRPSELATHPALPRLPELPELGEPDHESSRGPETGDSDVFVVRRSSPDLGSAAALAAKAAAEGVTLYVYGWENVQPGPLSWVFPSLRSALNAVKTMRNAVEWCIVAGAEWTSMDAARAKHAVLIEQVG